MLRIRGFLHLLGIVPAVLVLELAIRQYWVHARVWEPGYVKIPAPNSTSVWRTEGKGLVHRVEHGARAGTLPDAPKVVVLGDSFTEALEVNDDEVYTFVAQSALQAQGVSLGLVNLGNAGRSVADYIGFADRGRRLYQPVWTVVTLRDDDLAEDTVRPAKTSLRKGPDGKLLVSFDEKAEGEDARDLIWRSPSIFVRYTFYRLQKFIDAAAEEPPMFRAADHEGKKKGPPTAAELEAYYATFDVEQALDLLHTAHDGKLTIVTLPYLEYEKDGTPQLLDAPVRRRVLAWCAARKASCVEPGRAFLELARAHLSPFGFPNTRFNHGHMNREGHRLVGNALAAELARLKTDAVF